MDTIQEIQNLRAHLIQEINVTCDRMIQMLRTEQTPISELHVTENKEYEALYPLTSATGIFKGKKPIEVRFPDGSREDVRTWKNVVAVILKRCNKIQDKHDSLVKLCGKITGRERVFLASSKDGMRSPLEIGKDIYIETHYDTETLLRILTTRILGPIGYDYSGIKITIRND